MQEQYDFSSQPLLLNISQVMQLLSLSRSKVYKLIKFEGLPVVRFGRAVRISSVALQEWISQRQQHVA